MNYDNITKYYEILLKRERTSDQMYEALSDMLDKIWYDFNAEERELSIEIRKIPRDANKECHIRNILTFIKEKSMNTKTYANVFENKEDYLKLRDFWKAFYAEGKHKPVKVEYRTSKPFNSGYNDGEMAFHMESPLQFEHHLVYLAATGRNLDKATHSMQFSTLLLTRLRLDWYLRSPSNLKSSYFKLFGDAIDDKYHEVIASRIKAHLDERYEDARTNGWKKR